MMKANVPERIREHLSNAYIKSNQWFLPNGANFETSTPNEIKKVAVIGGGTMGRGIAIALTLAGYDTVVVEHTYEAVQMCQKEIALTIKREVSFKRLKDKQVQRLQSSALKFTTDLELVRESELVIEAVFENMQMKKDLFGKLERICPKTTIFGTNTSSLDIDDMSSVLQDPSRLVGIHFFNPPQVIRMVEIVYGKYTSGTAVATAFQACQEMKKVAILVGNCPNFVFNRLLFVYLNQSMKLLSDYGYIPKEVDKIVTNYGFIMGPLTVFDMNGLDVAEKIQKEHNIPATPLGEMMYKNKRYGRKTGKGFYKYDPVTRKKEDDPELDVILKEMSRNANPNIQLLCDKEVMEFLLFPMINEGFLCLEEGIIHEETLIDLMFILGFGWPAATGGPMKFGIDIGLKKISQKLVLWNSLNPEAREYKLSETLKKNKNLQANL